MNDGLRRAWGLIPGVRWISNAFANEPVRPLMKERNIASEALIEIADIWQVDHARSVDTEDGFDWWPGDFRVSVSAIRRTDGHEPETWMLSVKTDFLKDVPLNSDRFVRFASSSSGVYGATHAWVFPPAEVWDHYRTPGATPQLWFANTAYLTAENASWLPRFLADMSINQPINAPLAAKMQNVLGGTLNVSRPRLLGRSAQQDILGDALAVNSPWKTQPSRWIASGEFEIIAENWKARDQCVCRGDTRGFTLEIPLGESRTAIKLSTNQTHPQLGNGLLGELELPLFDFTKNVAERCASLNLGETMWTDIPQFGSWHHFALPDDHAAPKFSSFIPNALYGNGIASLMVLWLYQRYRFVVHGEYPTQG
jgi:hypothetical protein